MWLRWLLRCYRVIFSFASEFVVSRCCRGLRPQQAMPAALQARPGLKSAIIYNVWYAARGPPDYETPAGAARARKSSPTTMVNNESASYLPISPRPDPVAPGSRSGGALWGALWEDQSLGFSPTRPINSELWVDGTGGSLPYPNRTAQGWWRHNIKTATCSN